ncbi:hypothetical protein Tco_0443479 [Tanacetum coccineum]
MRPELITTRMTLELANRSIAYPAGIAEDVCVQVEPDPGELTRVLKKNISDTSTKDLKIYELNDFPLLLSECDSIFSEEFSEIDFLVLFPSGNKSKVFYPGIFTINGVHSKRFSILLLDDFSSILFIRDFLFLTDPSEIETFLSCPSGNEDKIPSDESKVHIEVLSVLWGNRLPIPDGSLPLSRQRQIMALHLPLCPSRVIRTIDEFGGSLDCQHGKSHVGGGVKWRGGEGFIWVNMEIECFGEGGSDHGLWVLVMAGKVRGRYTVV